MRKDHSALESVTAGEMLRVVLTGQRQHVFIQEQYSSYYIAMLDGKFDFSEGTDRLWVGVFQDSPLFAIIRDRHRSSGHHS